MSISPKLEIDQLLMLLNEHQHLRMIPRHVMPKSSGKTPAIHPRHHQNSLPKKPRKSQRQTAVKKLRVSFLLHHHDTPRPAESWLLL
jgi:hypothetical protein